MINFDTLFKKEKNYQLKITDPWLLQKVENGLKATVIKELNDRIRINKKIPIKYFEYNRIFGLGAFDSPMKITELINDLQSDVPNTKGFIFDDYKYLFFEKGILRIEIETNKESFFSEETLRNQNIACYLKLVYSDEEERLLSLIKELENATTNRSDSSDKDRKRISCKNTK